MENEKPKTPQLISFIPSIIDFGDSNETKGKSSCTHVGFSWGDLVRTLRLSIDVEWITLNEWGIFFCKDEAIPKNHA